MRKILPFFLILLSFELYSQETIKFVEAEFEFWLTKTCEETDCEITKIEVLKNGILKQTLIPGENYFGRTFPDDQLFVIEDMNFDGNPDFRLMEFLPAGPNVPYLFWIYNPKKELFEENNSYGKITSPEFDHENNQIHSFWRDGCCRHGRDVFELEEGSPEMTERMVIGHTLEGKEYSQHWKVQNGDLILVENKIE